MSKYKDEVQRRLSRLEDFAQIETKSVIPGLTWGSGGAPCYKSEYHGVAVILKLLLDDLGYEIADEGLVVRKVSDGD